MVSSAILDRLKQNRAKFQRGTKAYKFAEGRTTIRVLPHMLVATDENLPWYHQLAVCWIKADEKAKPLAVVGDVEFTYEDGRASELTPLIFQAISAAKAAGDEDGFKLYKSWLPKKSILVNGLIRAGADASETDPKIVEMGTTLFSDLMGAIIMYAEEGIDALDLKDGIDFVVERVGKGLDTTYTVMAAPRSKPVAAGVLEKSHDLGAHIKREHFREGEDKKAITAVVNLTGVKPSTAIAAPRATAMLTSSIASVAEEPEVVAEPAPAPKPAAKAPAKVAAKAAAPKVEPEPEVKAEPKPEPKSLAAAAPTDELNSMLAELDDLVL